MRPDAEVKVKRARETRHKKEPLDERRERGREGKGSFQPTHNSELTYGCHDETDFLLVTSNLQ